MFEMMKGQLGDVRSALADCPRDLSDAERIDLIRALEELKCTASAAQATTAVDLDESQRAAQVGRASARSGWGRASPSRSASRAASRPTRRLARSASPRSSSGRCPTPSP
jgi:hypothetical protein